MYKIIAIIENTILGSHTANNTGILPFIANILEIVVNKMYIALNANPIPNWSPIPPLIFLDERETPITIRIIAAKGFAYRF